MPAVIITDRFEIVRIAKRVVDLKIREKRIPSISG
jgi:hypothetical protein